MNWGNKLILVFIAFAGFMSFMVYKCMKTPVSLVSADYYKDELKYQEVIDGTAKAQSLSSQVQVAVQGAHVSLQLPAEMKQHQPSGHVWFYCVSNGKKDRRVELAPDESGKQEFALDMFGSGRYVVKIDWQADGANYYSEKEIIIP